VGFLSKLAGRRESAKTDALMVRGAMLMAVVGESYRQEALGRVARIATDASPFLDELDANALDAGEDEGRPWFRAALVREPNNPHDGNAVAVHASGVGLVGYLKRDDAARYGPVFASARKRGYKALACPAMLTGGGEGKDYGVVLAFSAPGYILQDLTADEH
jgi:HIRAN domain-containing protein